MSKKILAVLGSEFYDFISDHYESLDNIQYILNLDFPESRRDAAALKNDYINVVDFSFQSKQTNFPHLSEEQNNLFVELTDTNLLTDKTCIYAWERQLSVLENMSCYRNFNGIYSLLFAAHILSTLLKMIIRMLFFSIRS